MDKSFEIILSHMRSFSTCRKEVFFLRKGSGCLGVRGVGKTGELVIQWSNLGGWTKRVNRWSSDLGTRHGETERFKGTLGAWKNPCSGDPWSDHGSPDHAFFPTRRLQVLKKDHNSPDHAFFYGTPRTWQVVSCAVTTRISTKNYLELLSKISESRSR